MERLTCDPDRALDWVISQIGDARLAWFGTRGTDAMPLLAIPQFEGLFALIAPLDGLPTGVTQTVLEDITRSRVDLDAYTIDRDDSAGAREFYFAFAEWLTGPTFVAAYRPCDFLASVCYPRKDRVRYLGLFHGAQSAFDHKTWVETELAALGIPIIPWKYYAYHEVHSIGEDFAEHDRFVLRANASDGGRGVRMVRSDSDPATWLPPHEDRFLAAAPYLYPSVPLNVGGCVYPDGTVSLHGPSVQLIGIPECAASPFAYCGNDFGAIGGLVPPSALDELESVVRTTGRWLRTQGFIGAFGVDALCYRDQLYLTEVNPRFQGSSAPSALVDAALNRASLYTAHLAAHLGAVLNDGGLSLRAIVDAQGSSAARLSHVVSHNLETRPVVGRPVAGAVPGTILSCPDIGVRVEPNATLFRYQVYDSVLDGDGRMRDDTRDALAHMAASFGLWEA